MRHARRRQKYFQRMTSSARKRSRTCSWRSHCASSTPPRQTTPSPNGLPSKSPYLPPRWRGWGGAARPARSAWSVSGKDAKKWAPGLLRKVASEVGCFGRVAYSSPIAAAALGEARSLSAQLARRKSHGGRANYLRRTLGAEQLAQIAQGAHTNFGLEQQRRKN